MMNLNESVLSIKNVLLKLSAHIEIKLIIAQLFLFISWVLNGKTEIVATIYTLIAIDTITGFWCAIKRKEVSSSGFFRSPMKCMVYFLMLAVSRLVDKSLPVPVASPIMDAFLVTTEAVSVLENLSKLGYPVPLFLVTKLKTFYEKK